MTNITRFFEIQGRSPDRNQSDDSRVSPPSTFAAPSSRREKHKF